MPREGHYINRSNWLRAAVLGANDGILSTASLAVGVSAASDERSALLLAILAGISAGTLSMAAGEYVSVSSQTDLERADVERERRELVLSPESELEELAEIYVNRGLKAETALRVAEELHEGDPLEAHLRDELGIQEKTRPKPLQAALASGLSFLLGGALPLLVALLAPLHLMIPLQYFSSIFFLAMLGAASARMGGAPWAKAVMRITFWGTVAMVLTALVGYIFGTEFY